MEKKLVSIIMPTYNCGRFILQSIKSVQEQTYENWELIIVDDCSTDNTKDILREQCKKDQRIRYHRLPENSGAAVARTTAMRLAQGTYMAFLDSDDLWEEEKLERQLDFMIKHGYNFTCTSYQKMDENGALLGTVIKSIKRTDYRRLLLDCPVGNSTIMYNVDRMGKFEVPNIRKRNDDALWLKMLKKETYIYGLPDVLMRYRVRTNSLSKNKMSLVKYHWILYRDIEHLSIITSIFHIIYWGMIKVFRIKK